MLHRWTRVALAAILMTGVAAVPASASPTATAERYTLDHCRYVASTWGGQCRSDSVYADAVGASDYLFNATFVIDAYSNAYVCRGRVTVFGNFATGTWGACP